MNIRIVLVAAALTASVAVSACGDGTPSFCDTLRDNAQLDGLGSAISTGDLQKAQAEAERLGDISEQAPPAIREDLRSISSAVTDIVEHLRRGDESSTSASDAERERDRLNDRLGGLGPRIDRVSTWALRECGLKLDS